MALMQTKVSENGQVVLPASIRRQLGLKAGDALDAGVQNGNVVLTPRKKKKYKTWITTDPITGFPILTAEEGAPKLTREEVAELLVDFP